MARTARMSLADVLLKEKFITEDDLEKAREYQRENGGVLSDIFIKLGLVTEEQVVIGLAEQLGIPHMKLANYQLDPEVMEILPEKVVRENKVVPLSKSGNTLTVALANPLDILLIDDLKALTGCKIQTVVATPSEIEQTIADYYSAGTEKDFKELLEKSRNGDREVRVVGEDTSVDLSEVRKEAEEAPIISMVNLILSRAIKERATDVHIEPFEKKLQVRFRIDGILYPITSFPKRVQGGIISRIKILSDLDMIFVFPLFPPDLGRRLSFVS